jgi:hypothetical protein
MRRLAAVGILVLFGLLALGWVGGDAVAGNVQDRVVRSLERVGWAVDHLAHRIDDLVHRTEHAVERRIGHSERRTVPRAGRQDAEQFSWTGELEAGKQVEIKGVSGRISATAATGGELEVRATKSGRRSDPSEVRIEVVEHSQGVTLCAVYPRGGFGDNSCEPGERGDMEVRNNDVAVEWEVRVPEGVGFVGRTVNGDVEATGLGGYVDAHTVNGSIEITTRGYGEAATVNGSIRAALGQGGWSGPLRFSTVNGSISVELPADVDARVDARFLNGGLATDLPLRVEGRFGGRRAQGILGEGGPLLELSTVNGEIELRTPR